MATAAIAGAETKADLAASIMNFDALLIAFLQDDTDRGVVIDFLKDHGRYTAKVWPVAAGTSLQPGKAVNASVRRREGAGDLFEIEPVDETLPAFVVIQLVRWHGPVVHSKLDWHPQRGWCFDGGDPVLPLSSPRGDAPPLICEI